MTHVMVDGRPSIEKILRGLKEGRAVVSTGPMIELAVMTGLNVLYSGSEATVDSGAKIRVRYKTSDEFGIAANIRIVTAGTDGEKCLFKAGEGGIDKLPDLYNGEITLPLEGNRYLRAEIFTRTEEGREHCAYSNPIWLKPEK